MHRHEPLLPLPPDEPPLGPVAVPAPSLPSGKWFLPENPNNANTLVTSASSFLPENHSKIVSLHPVPGGWVASTLPDGTVCLSREQWWRKGYPHLSAVFNLIFLCTLLICFSVRTLSVQGLISGSYDHYLAIVQWAAGFMILSTVVGILALISLQEEIRLTQNKVEVYRRLGGKVWSDVIYGSGWLTIRTQGSLYNYSTPQLRRWTRILQVENSQHKIKLMYNTHFNSIFSSFTSEGAFDGDEADLMANYISSITSWPISYSQPTSSFL